MQIFNIGPMELIIILLIMFLLLGPKESILTAQRIGKWIRNLVRSPAWREIMGYSQEIRELPKKIMEDTGLEDTLKEVKASTQQAATEINAAVSESMQEVRKTSQEAAAEMNQAVKESVEAARVPEVEHLHLETGTSQTTVPAAMVEEPPQADPAVVETTDMEAVTIPAAESVETAVPATPDVETPKKPRRKKVPAVEEQAAAETPAASTEPAASSEPAVETPQPARRTRARKAASEVQTDLAVQLPSDTTAQVVAQPDASLEAPASGNNGSETAAPKKRRVKRAVEVAEEKQESE